MIPWDDENNLYWYKAQMVSNYDGDTITVNVDMGQGIFRNGIKVRLYGVDTPELRGEDREAGQRAKEFVARLLPIGCVVYLHTIKDDVGKYGRLLAIVCDHKGLNINNALYEAGLAVIKLYQRPSGQDSLG